MIGLFTPRDSPLHRMPAEIKLAGLAVVSVTAMWLPPAWAVATLFVGVCVSWRLAQLSWAAFVFDVRPVLWLGLGLIFIHALAGQVVLGLFVAGRLCGLIAAAMVVTRTTSLLDLLGVLTALFRPFERIGVPASKIAFLILMTIRIVPVATELVAETRRAVVARGGRVALRPLVLNAILRTVGYADTLGMALDARGFESRSTDGTT